MRKIKFRVYNTLTKVLKPPFSLNQALTYPNHPIVDDHHVLMQFTGLLDKNGKEIYEGDIVRGPLANGIGSYVETVGSVFYNNEHASFAIERPDDYENEWTIGKKFEIIGNIHQNPELLKPKKT